MPDAAPRRAVRGGGLDERSTEDRGAFAGRAVMPRRTIGERIAAVPQKSIFNCDSAPATGHAGQISTTRRDRERTARIDARAQSLPSVLQPRQYSMIVFKILRQPVIRNPHSKYNLTVRSAVG